MQNSPRVWWRKFCVTTRVGEWFWGLSGLDEPATVASLWLQSSCIVFNCESYRVASRHSQVGDLVDTDVVDFLHQLSTSFCQFPLCHHRGCGILLAAAHQQESDDDADNGSFHGQYLRRGCFWTLTRTNLTSNIIAYFNRKVNKIEGKWDSHAENGGKWDSHDFLGFMSIKKTPGANAEDQGFTTPSCTLPRAGATRLAPRTRRFRRVAGQNGRTDSATELPPCSHTSDCRQRNDR
jgi:hypothetical protein